MTFTDEELQTGPGVERRRYPHSHYGLNRIFAVYAIYAMRPRNFLSTARAARNALPPAAPPPQP